MASETTSAVPTGPSDSAPQSRGDGSRGGRGRGRGQGQRGRGRGGSNNFSGSENHQRNTNSGRRGGRGGAPRQPPAPRDTEGFHTGEEKDISAPSLTSKLPVMAGKTMAEGADEAEAEVCFICASPVMHEAIAPCNHKLCHICCLRMRALYKDNNCAHCRQPAPYVIFTDTADKKYEEYTDTDIASVDQNIGIRYELNSIVDDTRVLLQYNCPDPECTVACLGWPDLHKHVRAVHQKKICDLCSRHKKIFTHEHDLFTDAGLTKHMRKGDDNPGAIDQSGFRGHPMCGFCNQRFYGDDELFVHCREKHERCFICDTRSGPPQYYVNYDSLYNHFKKDHYVCSERECLDRRFVAFPNELDLKAHQLAEHGDSLSKDVRRDARVVDINSFDYRTPYVQEIRPAGTQREQREREGRGRGRGRDPNTEAIPASSAQPLRRDEQAFQRQMAIQTAQSVAPRTFGGALSVDPTPAQTRATPGPRPSANVENTTQAVNNLSISQTELSPAEQARQLRHRAVIERASTFLQHNQTKITHFRDSISAYQKSSITAAALIESFFALFADTSSSALGTLIREVADLFEDANKADGLRTAWNNWRAINEDYPSLPTGNSSASAIPLNWAVSSSSRAPATTGGGQTKSTRVLKLKSSTAQSSRSSVSQTRSWGTASTTSSSPVASSSSNPFPTLPPPSSRPNPTPRVNTIPWVASSSASNSNPGSARPTPPTSRPASRNVGGDAFPALPPAAKPQSTIFGYGNGRLTRDIRGNAPTTNAWSGTSSANADAPEAESEETAGKGKKKGNKGKKVVMSWG